MLDFSVYKPPAELKVNHTTGGKNAKKWKVRPGDGMRWAWGSGQQLQSAIAPGPQGLLQPELPAAEALQASYTPSYAEWMGCKARIRPVWGR